MSDRPIIQVRDNGSILVKGDVELLDAEGNKYETKPTFFIMPLWGFQKQAFLRWVTQGNWI